MASNFFQRWSDRSLATKDHAETDLEASKDVVAELDIDTTNDSAPYETSVVDSNSDLSNSSTDLIDEHVEEVLTIDDADKVTFDSGVASFLQHGVDKSVKKAALAKLFHADEFNYISDMDDHTEDFSNIPKLDESIAKQLRGWVKTVLEEPEAELIEETKLVEESEVLAATETEPETEVIAAPKATVDETTQSISADNSSTSCGGEKNCGGEQKNQLQQYLQQTGET
ncbi:DUF3306 domain-containing protein [Moritella sp. Urea-trap-13]|uniref:DUF3306 domain-containing protein n=1 Tax=Moritella sp. Urea-trap-13 TaxID=2058327 RepID=UPI000C32AF07|nr:DUF3306 domain-containing protein [Moritella sp. Urea-trap-13]PKH04674.1 DUF3306 domain-containing protein [Moritella sp. Urea-trap-13]